MYSVRVGKAIVITNPQKHRINIYFFLSLVVFFFLSSLSKRLQWCPWIGKPYCCNTIALNFLAANVLAMYLLISQGRLCALLLALCMEKVLLYIMMKKEKMACFQGYQSKFSFFSTVFCCYVYLECF